MPPLDSPPHALPDRTHSDTVVVSLVFVALLLAAALTCYLIVTGVKFAYRKLGARGTEAAAYPLELVVADRGRLNSEERVVSWPSSSISADSMKFGHDIFPSKGSDKRANGVEASTTMSPKLPSRQSRWAFLGRNRSKSVTDLRSSISSPSSFVTHKTGVRKGDETPPPVPAIPAFPPHIHPAALSALHNNTGSTPSNTPPSTPPTRPPRSPARTTPPRTTSRPSSPAQRLMDAANDVVGPHPSPEVLPPPVAVAPRFLESPEFGHTFASSFIDLDIPWVTKDMAFGFALPSSQTPESSFGVASSTGSNFSSPIASPVPSTRSILGFSDTSITGERAALGVRRSNTVAAPRTLKDITNLPNTPLPLLLRQPAQYPSEPLLESDGKYPKPTGAMLRHKTSMPAMKARRRRGQGKENEPADTTQAPQPANGRKVRNRAATVSGAGKELGARESGLRELQRLTGVEGSASGGVREPFVVDVSQPTLHVPKPILGMSDRFPFEG